MKLYIIALLAAISYAQTVNYQGAEWLLCSTSADCGGAEGGAYCDNGKCLVCPASGCAASTYVQDIAKCSATCESSGARISCTSENQADVCNDGFCNVRAQQINTGNCVSCAVVNTLDDIKEQCISSPALTTWNARVNCRDQCEKGEMADRTQTEVNYIPQDATSRYSDLEFSFPSGACANVLLGRQICLHDEGAYGAREIFGAFADNYAYADHEIGCGTRSCEGVYCMVTFENEGEPCTVRTQLLDTTEILVAGTCYQGSCIVTSDAGCPDGKMTNVYDAGTCLEKTVGLEWLNLVGDACIPETSRSCEMFGRQTQDVVCHSTSNIPDVNANGITAKFAPIYFDAYLNKDAQKMGQYDQVGRCMIRSSNSRDLDCIMVGSGYYSYNMMDITFYELTMDDGSDLTLMTMPLQTRTIVPVASCPQGGRCKGEIHCNFDMSRSGTFPCGNSFRKCVEGGTVPQEATQNPTKEPTLEPTLEPTMAFGDPIVWTFDGLCYDLNQDGFYLASSHTESRFDHDVYISVYNHYMREIQVVNSATGHIMLSINNLGDVINNYPYYFLEESKKCESEDECSFFYKQYSFDAQQFEYVVQIHPHAYDDPSLNKGETGVHLDIYPSPYGTVDFENYDGLFFKNPIPEVSGTCHA